MTLRDRIIDLRRVPVDELRANPKNWRRHPPAQAKALRAMIDDVGFADALIARETPEGLMLIDGHLRLSQSGPADVLPVLVLDVDEAEADRLLATLDPLAAMAEVDAGALEALLAEVSIPSADLMQFLAPNGKAGKTDPDAVPPVLEQPVTKPGDLWVLGDHRLLCGDATDPEAQARLLTTPDQLLVTDPPYGVNYSELVDGRGNQKAGGWRPIKNDDMRGEALGELLTGAFGASRASTAFVWFGHEQRVYVEAALTAVGFMVAQEIVWVKNALVLSRGADYHWRHEQAAFAKRKGHQAPPTRDQNTVWEVDKSTASVHPTQKPVELYRIPIANHTLPGQVVYDPFAGSGTVLVAAEMTERIAVAMELDPTYCDVSVRRWEDFTGRKAERTS